MILPIITYPKPVLKQKATPISKVDKNVKETVKNMIETLKSRETPEVSGAGLAAPQVGVSKRVFIVKINKDFIPFINPEVKAIGGETSDSFEGCFSVPGYFGTVKRFSQVEVKSLTLGGKTAYRRYSNFYAHVIQHEMDHINGVLFIDRLKEQGGKLFKYLGKDPEGKDKFLETFLK
jgi:peptide deformylase